MIIELKGVGTINKGAYLMLLAIVDQFKQKGIKVEFVSEPGYGIDYKSMGKLGFLQKFNPHYKKIPFAKVLELMPYKIRRSYGLVLQKEVDVVLDGSGFMYGDTWGAKGIRARLGNEIKALKDNGAKVILLPQAFGPFDKSETKEAFKPIIKHADLIFCRDKKSFDYLVGAFGQKENIKLAPDFTNLLKVKTSKDGGFLSKQVCIVPNYRMIEETSYGKNYLDFFTEIIGYIKIKGLNPYFLIHEGDRDLQVAKKINSSLEHEIPIIVNENPLEIKLLIKESRFIIVSRFHGLVSALSQGVPAISTSWSHKYEMLMAEYKADDMIIRISNDDNFINEAKQLVDQFCVEENFVSIKEKIKEGAIVQEQRSKEMWDEVFYHLTS